MRLVTRRRPDKLDPRSREARLANGIQRIEIEVPVPDLEALDDFIHLHQAEHPKLSRSRVLLNLLRFGVRLAPAVLVLLCLAACDRTSQFVRDVEPLSDGSLRITRCEADRDLMGRNVDGKCHTLRRPVVRAPDPD